MTIRIYLGNGHHVKDVDMALSEFEELHRAAEARPGGFIRATDGKGFVHSIRPSAVTHAIEDKD